MAKYPQTPAKYPSAPNKYPGSSVARYPLSPGLYPSSVNNLAFAGDSLMMGFNSTGTNGERRDVSFYVNNNGLLIDFQGSLGPTGSTPPTWDRDHCAQNGASSATIMANVLADIASGAMNRIRLLIIDMGINDVANTGTAGIAAAATVYANLKTIQAALITKHPDAQIVFKNLMPVKPATTGEFEISPFNNEFSKVGGYRDTWNTTDFPNNKLEIYDAFTAIGGVWDTTLYGGDRLHQAQAGYDLLSPALVLLLRTSSIVTLRGIKNGINALACTITAPVTSETIAYGVPYMVTGTVSRAKQDVTVVVKKGSTTLGTATVDQYTRIWTYSATFVVGDLGALTINATVTDNIDSSTANATGVAVTIVSPVDFATPETYLTSVPILRQWIGSSGVTTVTGASLWVDRINSGTLAQASVGLQPLVTASDATLNSLTTIRGDGVDDYMLDPVLNLPAPGTQNIWMYLICKPRTWTSGDHFLANNVSNYRLGQLAAASPQTFFSNGTISGAASPVLNTWIRIEVALTNSTADYMKCGSTTVGGGASGYGNNDPAANFFLFARNVAGYADLDVYSLIITQGIPTAGEKTTNDSAMLSKTNNIPTV